MSFFGSDTSSSTSNVSNVTSTFTSTFANAFNNALNTTQNFSGIGGVTTGGGISGPISSATPGDVFTSFNWGTILALIAGAFAVVLFLKKRK